MAIPQPATLIRIDGLLNICQIGCRRIGISRSSCIVNNSGRVFTWTQGARRRVLDQPLDIIPIWNPEYVVKLVWWRSWWIVIGFAAIDTSERVHTWTQDSGGTVSNNLDLIPVERLTNICQIAGRWTFEWLIALDRAGRVHAGHKTAVEIRTHGHQF